MLLAYTIGYAYLIATAGLGILLLIVANKFMDQHAKQGKVRLVGGISLGLGILGVIVYWMFCTNVIVMEQKDGNVSTTKLFMLGSAKIDIDGKSVNLDSKSSGTWIVNRTSLTASVEVREYGSASSSPPEEIVVEPQTAGAFGSTISLIGPENSPPSSVSSKSSSEIRCWLTWFDAAALPPGLE